MEGAEEAAGAAAAVETPKDGAAPPSRPDENGIDRFAAGSSSSSRARRLPEVARGVVVVDAGSWPNNGAVSVAPEVVGCEGWVPKEKDALEAAGALASPDCTGGADNCEVGGS